MRVIPPSELRDLDDPLDDPLLPLLPLLPPPPPPLPPPTLRGLVFAIGVVAGVVLYCGARAFGKSYGESFFCAPFVVGTLIGVLAPRRPVYTSLVTLASLLGIALVTLQEGVICCLFALPLVVPETIVGALCGSVIRRFVHNRRVRTAIGGLLVAGALAWQAIGGALDDPARHPLHHARSSITIAATPERVFAALTARPLTVEARWPWFLRVGLPMPSRFSVDAPGPNGRVRAVFSAGVARGHITEWAPGRALAFQIDGYTVDDLPFHITRLGRGPHYGLHPDRVDDWLTLTGVRYRLEPAPGGGTRLIRDVSWRRHLAPAFYFAWLQDTIMRRGQDRLLELVRRQVEEVQDQPAAGAGPAVAALPARPRL
jgi:uncharacterized protein YndB with AHSA1/START domain